MKNGATIYLYELAWILPSIAIPVGMLSALLVTAFGAGIHVPSDAGHVDIATLAQKAPFDKLGLVEVGPLRYEVRMIGQIWNFGESEIRVPAGSTVTFLATSRDVVHGLFIPKANINVMLLPGQLSRVTRRFDKPGEYAMMCHEYCGIAHHTMGGKIIVVPRAQWAAGQ
jgi:cytochrome c oxidase subunit II